MNMVREGTRQNGRRSIQGERWKEEEEKEEKEEEERRRGGVVKGGKFWQ